MKRLAVLLIVVLALQGCATTRRQLFVGPGGGTVTCSDAGRGISLAATVIASSNYSSCCSTMRIAGFLEVELAGAVGMMLCDPVDGGHPSVLRVIEPSPAWEAGVGPGDLIIEVEGQEVHSMKDAQVLLFDVVGSSVTVHFQRGDSDTTLVLTRAPHLAVFGRFPLTGGS